MGCRLFCVELELDGPGLEKGTIGIKMAILVGVIARPFQTKQNGFPLKTHLIS
jgi:hypothetical protein